MVGIILASHGSFADGIFQSGEMIFGQQENVAHVTLMPSEGPDDIRAKMEEAIKSFDDPEEVLFLVDLWGGTPFNQANNLVEQHKDKWAIVAGMNLPMVIEAYASRFSMEKAQEIAAHLVNAGKDGVRVKPESLEPKKEASAANTAKAQPTGAIPPGTVLGDGKIKYVWNFHTGKEELFDLQKDPKELVECSGKPAYVARLKEMRQAMVEHLTERGETFVKDGKLVARETTMLYSPNYPQKK